MRKLEIDPEFRDLLPALSEDEFNRLEESMIDYGGCHSPILVWGDTIIDGHNRWKILQEHPELTNYKIQQMNYIDRHEAIYWILQNQLGRRNLQGIARDLMIARAYEEQMQIRGGDHRSQKVQKHGKQQIGSAHPRATSEKVAKDFGVGQAAPSDAHMLKKGLTAAEEVSPGFTNKVLSGEIKAPKTVLRDLRKLPTEARKGATEAIKSGDLKEAKEIIKKQETNKATIKPASLNANVQKAIESLESTEPDEMLTIKSEVPAMVDDFIRKFDRMYELHKDAIQTAEGKAVMIENLTTVKNWIDERMKRYEE